MDDLQRLTQDNKKVFIQRDYADGTAVQFQTKFPPELEGKVRTKITPNSVRIKYNWIKFHNKDVRDGLYWTVQYYK